MKSAARKLGNEATDDKTTADSLAAIRHDSSSGGPIARRDRNAPGDCGRPETSAETTVAALYVEKDGAYYDLPGVDPWDEERDARRYAGPWPVVAHPPCKVWSQMGHCRPEIVRGADGGCFKAALTAVREFGGVLEHPAHSSAWGTFGLQPPPRYGWARELLDEGWVCEIDQAIYGHRANKRTWLYYVGPPPAMLDWNPPPRRFVTVRNDGGGGRDQRSRTPVAFRDLLLDMARGAQVDEADRSLKVGCSL